MTDEQKPKTDPSKPPENATGRQVAAWLRRGIKVHHKNQATERAKLEAKQMAERARLAEQKRQAQIANIRASASSAATMNVTPGKVASFLWMPQFNHSFRGFSFAIAILVQIFARILMSVGLLEPDHPARTPTGAQGFGLFKLLEEARLNLLPLRALQEKPASTGPFAGIRALAVRQYIVFSSVIGVMVTGFLSGLMEISRIVFGSAHAFAQSTTATATSGISMGGCPNPSTFSSGTGTTTTDYASACLDGIFGTGSSSTSSIVSSGLGTMFQLYSNMMLVFAGIIVLWIIISTVAETARTGVPFGKNFNSVWTPIRLIVALGLLVPLGSGLNSGQYIVINLAKWGSSQATTIWNGYAQKMTSAATSSGGTLPAVPVNTDAATNFAKNMFKIALCAQASDQTCGTGVDNDNCPGPVTRTGLIPVTQSNAAESISSTGATQMPPTTTLNEIRWYSATPQTDGGNGLPIPGTAYCGSVKILTPNTSATGTSNSQTSGPQSAAQSAVNTLLNSQSSLVTQTVENSMQSVAHKIVQDAIVSEGTSGSTAPDTSSDYIAYQNAINNYVGTLTNSSSSSSSGGIQQAVQTAVAAYNSAISSAMTANAKQFGWIYAPVWLINIVNANAMVMDAANALPQVTPPAAEPFDSNEPNGKLAWDQARNIIRNGEMEKPTSSPNLTSLFVDMQNLTSMAGSNPLAMAGTYGHSMVMNGFIAITPPKVVECFNGSINHDCDDLNDVIRKAGATPGAGAVLPTSAQNSDFAQIKESVRPIFSGIGMIMISMGFMLIMLTFLPLTRFILGVLNWLMLVFEAILAVPLIALSLLATGGEGFSTQQFTSNLWLLVGIVLRPVLMSIGMVLGLTAFNNIMQITNAIFAPAVAGMTSPTDNSLMTLGIYLAIYATLAYTLANSAFKMIDLMPNWVMSWIGARMESRVDDASAIQQQAGQFVQTLAYSNKAEQADLGNKRERTGMQQEMMQKASELGKTNAAYAPNKDGTFNNQTLQAARDMTEQNHGGLKIDPNEKPFGKN